MDKQSMDKQETVKQEICMCVPKGDALDPLMDFFNKCQFPIDGYNAKNRTYRPSVKNLPVPIRAKIMAEKDIALQIAASHYDIGFCGLNWAKEHAVRYRATKLHIYKHLELNRKKLVLCSGKNTELVSLEDLQKTLHMLTIVTEYPNLAEDFAIKSRLKKFKIFSTWGDAENYPPEHADLALIAVNTEIPDHLHEIQHIMTSDLCIVINQESFVSKLLSPVLSYFGDNKLT